MTRTTEAPAWTVDEFTAAAAGGRVSERSELVAGEVWEQVPPGPEHVWAVTALTRALSRSDTYGLWLSVQNPLRYGLRDQPEPDLALLRLEHPTGRMPDGRDAVLVIEVSDSSLEQDRSRKVPLYARACVGELWLVDLVHGAVVRHREPTGSVWQSIDVHREGVLAPEAAPGLVVDVAAVLGGRTDA